MKHNILTFLLGVFVTISIAATTTDLMTVKPATPKSVVIIECRSSYVNEYAKPYIKQGYQVEYVAGAYYDYDGLLILRKY